MSDCSKSFNVSQQQNDILLSITTQVEVANDELSGNQSTGLHKNALAYNCDDLDFIEYYLKVKLVVPTEIACAWESAYTAYQATLVKNPDSCAFYMAQVRVNEVLAMGMHLMRDVYPLKQMRESCYKMDVRFGGLPAQLFMGTYLDMNGLDYRLAMEGPKVRKFKVHFDELPRQEGSGTLYYCDWGGLYFSQGVTFLKPSLVDDYDGRLRRILGAINESAYDRVVLDLRFPMNHRELCSLVQVWTGDYNVPCLWDLRVRTTFNPWVPRVQISLVRSRSMPNHVKKNGRIIKSLLAIARARFKYLWSFVLGYRKELGRLGDVSGYHYESLLKCVVCAGRSDLVRCHHSGHERKFVYFPNKS